MANQQQQLMSLLVARPPHLEETRIPNNSHTNAGPKVRMADPPTFDGSIKDTENFLSSIENIFDSQPSSFPTDESKIRYTLTFLTGGASNWRKLLLRDVSDGNFSLSSWSSFEQRFLETFSNPHLVDEARHRLWTIKQGSRTAEDFFLEFEEIRLEANICENSLVMFLQAAIRPSILQEVLCREPPPVSYSDWKTATLRADHNQRNTAATKSFHLQSSIQPSQRHNSFTPFRSRFNNAPTPTPVQISTSSLPTTDLSTKNRPTGNPPKKNSNCWKCGKEGHLSNKCPDNATNTKLRALFEHCDDLEAAFEATSSGADFIRNLMESPSESIDDEERAVLERFISDHPVFVELNE